MYDLFRRLLTVYYKLFGEDGAVRCNRPISPNHSKLGRCDAGDVAPPYTALRVKKHIAKLERNPDLEGAELYVNFEADALADDFRLLFSQASGAGSSPSQPIGLVVPGLKYTPDSAGESAGDASDAQGPEADQDVEDLASISTSEAPILASPKNMR